MKLSIVIPAYNEEQAIGSTIDRCLAARARITASSPVDDVEIIVVSDGSTDNTVPIAATYSDVHLIVFEENRGYGAAIKQGFAESSGELVAFLDADGTCDPNFFAVLCDALIERNASVSLGSRMGPESKMPGTRRLGNRVYALILSALSNRVVTDTASGMRVIRRDCLESLYPLPDGLHFTPAMSARILMDDRLKIVECPMAYEERVGQSKLHVVKDGLRFLRIILAMAFLWRPARLLTAGATVCLVAMILLAMHPVEMWLSLGRIREDMIYRLLFCSFLGTVGAMLLSAGVLCDNLHRLIHPDGTSRTFLATVMDRAFTSRGFVWVGVPALMILVWLVGAGFWTRVTAGYVDVHWSRVVLAGLIAFGCLQMGVTVLVANLIRFHTARRQVARSQRIISTQRTTRQANKTIDGWPIGDRAMVPPVEVTNATLTPTVLQSSNT